jgi:hypothetical protein
MEENVSENENELIDLLERERVQVKSEIDSYNPIVNKNRLAIQKLTLLNELIKKYDQEQ